MGSDPALPPDGGVDRAFSLEDLLPPARQPRLLALLAPLLGECRICGAQEPPAAGALRAAIVYEIDTLGWLEGAAEPARLRAGAGLLAQLALGEARYRMASSLHLETVRADYEELSRRHAALAESEARYRELAASLEQRVAEQVRSLESAQRKLYQSEKMAAVGQLAAGIAHEINNPIGFIRSNLNTARHYLSEIAAAIRSAPPGSPLAGVLEDFAQLLGESIEGADRVRHIVSDLKDFAGVDNDQVGPCDLNEIVAKVCEVGRQRLAKAQIVLDLAPLPKVTGHAGNLGQALLHLLSNAVDAAGAGGVVRVSSGAREGMVSLVVTDNGPGIDPAHLERIFEPFFTTKPVGEGTGLGLTVCHDIVRAHGGRIEVKSLPGKGSRFAVLLPVR